MGTKLPSGSELLLKRLNECGYGFTTNTAMKGVMDEFLLPSKIIDFTKYTNDDSIVPYPLCGLPQNVIEALTVVEEHHIYALATRGKTKQIEPISIVYAPFTTVMDDNEAEVGEVFRQVHFNTATAITAAINGGRIVLTTTFQLAHLVHEIVGVGGLSPARFRDYAVVFGRETIGLLGRRLLKTASKLEVPVLEANGRLELETA